MTKPTPAAETHISTDLVHALLVEQCPPLAGEATAFVSSGWDNEIHRIGDHHAIRMPRRNAAAALIEHEQRWLPELAPTLPLPIPAPSFAGSPALGYPWSWSIVPWLPGVPIAHSPPLETDRLIEDLTGFLNALHQPAPADAPENPYRGVPLEDRSDAIRSNTAITEGIDRRAVLELWDDLVATPAWGEEALWLHGDMHPLNLLVYGGRLSAVIDWGDITSGDPASDLAVGWMLFEEPDRAVFRDALELHGHGVGVHTWKRARAWALNLGIAFAAHSSDNPTMRRIGMATIERAMA